MFARVVHGRVTDDATVWAAYGRWVHNADLGESGKMLTTAGFSEDGTFVALVAADSQGGAGDIAGRAWWDEQDRPFAEGPYVRDSTDVVVVQLNGDLREATFVLVVQGRYLDSDQVKELSVGQLAEWAAFAPHLIGSISAYHDGGHYTLGMYYTSEAAADAAEFDQPPPSLEATMTQIGSLNLGLPHVFRLRNPSLGGHRPSR